MYFINFKYFQNPRRKVTRIKLTQTVLCQTTNLVTTNLKLWLRKLVWISSNKFNVLSRTKYLYIFKPIFYSSKPKFVLEL